MRINLNNDELDVVKKIVQHDAHMTHPENILLCAIIDEDQDHRKIALEKILRARRDGEVNQPILVRVTLESRNTMPKINTKK